VLDFAHAREWLLQRLKTPLTWVYVTIGLALSAAAGAFLQSYFLAGFEKVTHVSRSFVGELWCQRRMASIKGRLSDDEFRVLVSPLQGDANHAHTAKLFIALGEQGGIRLLEVCQSLQIHVGNDYLTEQNKAVQRGRDMLKEWGADLILFGKVAADNSLHIWTVNEHGGCDFSAKPVVLTNGALPGEFEKKTKAKLLGAVLREIAAACHHQDDMNWDLFRRQMRKLKVLISTLDLQEEEQLELSTPYFNGLNLLYNQYGDVEWFEAAEEFATRVFTTKGTEHPNVNVLYLAARMFASKGTELRKVQVLYLYARALLVKGAKTNDKEALNLGIKAYDQILPMIPESRPRWRAEALRMRSYGHTEVGDTELALQDLSEAIRVIPASEPEERTKALIARSNVHKSQGDYELAIRDLDEAVRLSPEDPEVRQSRCVRLAQIGRPELALADCNESLKLRPNDRVMLVFRDLLI
jgi:tetratricopeptide (TPR) repeat protein